MQTKSDGMSFFNRNGYDYDSQQLLNDNKIQVEKLKEMNQRFKKVEEMNAKLAERIKQQSDGMTSMLKDHEKYVEYCEKSFNNQLQEETENCFRWRLKATNLAANLKEAESEIAELKKRIVQKTHQRDINDQLKKRSNISRSPSESEDSDVRIDDRRRFRPMTLDISNLAEKDKRTDTPKAHIKPKIQKTESKSDADRASSLAESSSGEERSDAVRKVDCRSAIKQVSPKRQQMLFWDGQMDEKLRNAVDKHGNNWAMVVKETGFGSREQCRKRWRRLVTPNFKPDYTQATQRKANSTPSADQHEADKRRPDKSRDGRFSGGEDAIILSAVATRGSKDPSLWSDLAAIFGRSESSVEQRWIALCDED